MNERMTLTAVALPEFVEDITRGIGYSFLKVLRFTDRNRFVATLTPADRLLCYQHRGIQLSTWLGVMKVLDLDHGYVVARIAYFGEITGSARIGNRRTHKVIPLWSYSKHHDRPPPSCWDSIFNRAPPKIRILLDVDRAVMCFVPTDMEQVSWHRTDYEVKDVYYS
jgi:hypothetical protein